MPKTYREYCLEAIKRNPRLYKPCFTHEGKPRPIPKFSIDKKNAKDIPVKELKKLPKDGFKDWPCSNKIKIKKEVSIKITGTQVVMHGKKIDMRILPLPSKCGIRSYNKIWMHNFRVRQRIKKLKKEFGITFTL